VCRRIEFELPVIVEVPKYRDSSPVESSDRGVQVGEVGRVGMPISIDGLGRDAEADEMHSKPFERCEVLIVEVSPEVLRVVRALKVAKPTSDIDPCRELVKE
jgi:hypothetical protein